MTPYIHTAIAAFGVEIIRSTIEEITTAPDPSTIDRTRWVDFVRVIPHLCAGLQLKLPVPRMQAYVLDLVDKRQYREPIVVQEEFAL